MRVDFLRKRCCVHRPGQSRLSAQLALSVIACICNNSNGVAIKNRFATYKCCPEQEWVRECGTCLKNKTTNQQAVEFAPAPPPSVAVSGDNLPLGANTFFAVRFFCCILRSCGTWSIVLCPVPCVVCLCCLKLCSKWKITTCTAIFCFDFPQGLPCCLLLLLLLLPPPKQWQQVLNLSPQQTATETIRATATATNWAGQSPNEAQI